MKVAPGDAVGPQALFLAVLECAIADALGKPSGIGGQQKAAAIHSARAWVRAGRLSNSDFRTICALAGMNADSVRAVVLAHIERLERKEAEEEAA